MAHHSDHIGARTAVVLPRGLFVGGLAILSWALTITLWNVVTVSFAYLTGV